MRYVLGFVVGVLLAAGFLMAAGCLVHISGPPDYQAGYEMALLFFWFPVLGIFFGLLGIATAYAVKPGDGEPENGGVAPTTVSPALDKDKGRTKGL